MKKKKKTILLIPSIRKGNGTGHLKRCVLLAERLQLFGAEAGILIDSAEARRHSCYTVEQTAAFFSKSRRKKPRILTDAVASDWDICIFDTRQANLSRVNNFNGISLCIGLDEGGASREYFDYLIDILPNLEKTEPNISSPGFLELPEKPTEHKFSEADFDRQHAKILITFGGEDPQDLTGKFLEMAEDTGIFKHEELTVVQGPLFSKEIEKDGVEVLKAPSNLSQRLAEWDLVITSFGLTCFEALYSGVPVLLFNPSGYHRSLSIRAGIPEIGVNSPDAGRLEDYLGTPERLFRAVKTYSGLRSLDLASYLLQLSDGPRNICSGCGRKHHRIIYRNTDLSFFKCSNCGLVNQLYFGSDSMDYGKEYFFEDYRKQYGRTYLEDFRKIKAAGTERCSCISKIMEKGRLLDIGCGYGPFLSAADEAGYEVSGIDVSKEAAAYVSDELGFSSSAVSLEDFDAAAESDAYFDIITMWFVIEHLKDPAASLCKINSMLKRGGVFAFSTPNFNGITRRFSIKKFLTENPLDHYNIWSRQSALRLLKKYGFKLKYVRTPVVHPERFFRNQDNYSKLKGPLKKITDSVLSGLSRILLLGDTFEVYAVKISEKKENK